MILKSFFSQTRQQTKCSQSRWKRKNTHGRKWKLKGQQRKRSILKKRLLSHLSSVVADLFFMVHYKPSNSLLKLILVLFKLWNAFNSKYYTFWEPISSEFIVRYYEKNNFLGCLNYNQNLGTNVAAKIINRCKSDNLNVLFYFKQWYSSHPLFIFVIIRKPIKLRSSILFILKNIAPAT